jgi:GMP synthase-like glutamine amidotransferase
VRLLSIQHPKADEAGTFALAAREAGHVYDEWCPGVGQPAPGDPAGYDGILVLGGEQNVVDAPRLRYLQDEIALIVGALERQQPLLGVCLGAQLLAKAASAPVVPSSEPEVGWFAVELTEEGRDDPVLGLLPSRFEAFQWHFYTHGLPAGAVELARSRVCTQAFRLGESAWGVQFHPEVTAEQVEGWIAEDAHELPVPAGDFAAETARRIADWNELGRKLCAGFLEVAARAPVSV